MQPIDKRLSVFTPTVIRELTHKKYDRRKVAALEVERYVATNNFFIFSSRVIIIIL